MHILRRGNRKSKLENSHTTIEDMQTEKGPHSNSSWEQHLLQSLKHLQRQMSQALKNASIPLAKDRKEAQAAHEFARRE